MNFILFHCKAVLIFSMLITRRSFATAKHNVSDQILENNSFDDMTTKLFTSADSVQIEPSVPIPNSEISNSSNIDNIDNYDYSELKNFQNKTQDIVKADEQTASFARDIAPNGRGDLEQNGLMQLLVQRIIQQQHAEAEANKPTKNRKQTLYSVQVEPAEGDTSSVDRSSYAPTTASSNTPVGEEVEPEEDDQTAPANPPGAPLAQSILFTAATPIEYEPQMPTARKFRPINRRAHLHGFHDSSNYEHTPDGSHEHLYATHHYAPHAFQRHSHSLGENGRSMGGHSMHHHSDHAFHGSNSHTMPLAAPSAISYPMMGPMYASQGMFSPPMGSGLFPRMQNGRFYREEYAMLLIVLSLAGFLGLLMTMTMPYALMQAQGLPGGTIQYTNALGFPSNQNSQGANNPNIPGGFFGRRRRKRSVTYEDFCAKKHRSLAQLWQNQNLQHSLHLLLNALKNFDKEPQ